MILSRCFFDKIVIIGLVVDQLFVIVVVSRHYPDITTFFVNIDYLKIMRPFLYILKNNNGFMFQGVDKLVKVWLIHNKVIYKYYKVLICIKQVVYKWS